MELADDRADLGGYGNVVENMEGRIKLRVPKAETARVTGQLLTDLDVLDLTVEDPPIEDVMEQVFAEELVLAHGKVSPTVGTKGNE